MDIGKININLTKKNMQLETTEQQVLQDLISNEAHQIHENCITIITQMLEQARQE